MSVNESIMRTTKDNWQFKPSDDFSHSNNVSTEKNNKILVTEGNRGDHGIDLTYSDNHKQVKKKKSILTYEENAQLFFEKSQEGKFSDKLQKLLASGDSKYRSNKKQGQTEKYTNGMMMITEGSSSGNFNDTFSQS